MNRAYRYVAAGLVGLLSTLVLISPAAADPIRDAQWHLTFLKVAQAHRLSQGDGVTVAVIDTGVDASHPDLVGNILPGKDFTTEATDDGWQDFDGHGTAMAGLIAASGRALGIAPKAKVLPVRDAVYGLSPVAADRSIVWAVDNGANILCLAYGQPDSNQLREAIEYAVASDVIVVASIGNDPRPAGFDYPGAYSNVVAVAGVDRSGRHAAVSVVGPQAVLAAPAVEIASTDTRIGGNTGYRSGTGTSDATAIIAGAAALVRARFPEMSAAEVVHRLTATADDKGPPGRDDQYGYGIVNLVEALSADVPPLLPSPTATAAAAIPPSDGGDGLPTSAIIVIGAVTLVVLVAAGFVASGSHRQHR